MSETRDMRKEYDDGTLSVSEWNKVIDEFLDEEKRAGQVGPVPSSWENIYIYLSRYGAFHNGGLYQAVRVCYRRSKSALL